MRYCIHGFTVTSGKKVACRLFVILWKVAIHRARDVVYRLLLLVARTHTHTRCEKMGASGTEYNLERRIKIVHIPQKERDERELKPYKIV